MLQVLFLTCDQYIIIYTYFSRLTLINCYNMMINYNCQIMMKMVFLGGGVIEKKCILKKGVLNNFSIQYLKKKIKRAER